MKKQILLVAWMGFMVSAASQTVLLQEHFEPPNFGDSVTSSVSPAGPDDWNINNRLAFKGLYSDSCQVQQGRTTYLTTMPVSCVGYTTVMLTFSQICKVDFLDIARIEVSADWGITWNQLSSAQYTGTGQFGSNGNRFASNSYGVLWMPSAPSTLPQNSWWRTESFNLTYYLQNAPGAMVRFCLQDGGTPGPNSNNGWYLDDIEITGSGGYNNTLTGTVFYENGSLITSGDVTLFDLSNNVFLSAPVQANGTYTFMSIPPGIYTVYAQPLMPWGGVNASDALLCLQYFTGGISLTGLPLRAADVSNNGVVNALDALMILQRFTGMISEFPAGDWASEYFNITMSSSLTVIQDIKVICPGDVNASY